MGLTLKIAFIKSCINRQDEHIQDVKLTLIRKQGYYIISRCIKRFLALG